MNVYELRTTRRGRFVAYEVQRPAVPGPFGRRRPDVMAAAAPVPDPSDFEQRVTARRVDLIKLIEEGVPPIEYLPRSDGMLIRGKRHLVPAPKKSGKSITMLVHWATMVLAGAKVVVFDRENGGKEYASRLDDIITAWGLNEKARKRIQRDLQYYEYPRFRLGDGDDLAALALEADVVAFDATRMFLTDLGLKEDSADDYSLFMASLVDPLAEANVASVILDNTGHADKKRARATSAKGDLNEVLFTFERVEQFTLRTPGKVRLSIAESRFGNEGTWEMHIGGGAFMPWKRIDEERPIDPEFRQRAEQLLVAAGKAGYSLTKLVEAIRASGITVRNETARDWMHRLAADPAIPVYSAPPEKKGLPAMFYGFQDADGGAGRGTPS